MAPLSAYAVLGLPMDELSEHLLDLYDVLGAEGHRLAEQVRSAPTWQRRFQIVDQFLLRRFESGPRPAPEVAVAWQRLVASGGAARIGRIAERCGLEPQTPDREVQAADRPDAKDGVPAGTPRPGMAPPRYQSGIALGPLRRRRRLRGPGASRP